METPQITPQPSSTLVYFNLGNIYLEKGYMENAQLLLTSMQVTLLLLLLPPPPLMFQEMYVNVITLDPLYRGAFNNLGNALKEADFFDHAIRRVPAASCASSLSTASHSIPIFLRAWNAALRILPSDVDVFANIMYSRFSSQYTGFTHLDRHLRMHLCDWTNRVARFAALRRTIDRQSALGNRGVRATCDV